MLTEVASTAQAGGAAFGALVGLGELVADCEVGGENGSAGG